MSKAVTTRTLSEGWVFREENPSPIPNSHPGAWLPARVPGHVHLDLHQNGVIADPLVRMHERGVQWVDEVDWTYRCEFSVDQADLADGRHVLCFDGLDTIATIVLNENVIGETDNMFVAHELEVTSALLAGANVLEVRFASAQRVAEERLAALGAGDEEAADLASRPDRLGLTPRSMVRKAQYMFGWDWGPRLRSCGIWQDVKLLTVPLARITATAWDASFEPGGRCIVSVRVDLDGDADGLEVMAHLTGHGAEVRSGVDVKDGRAEVKLMIDDPQRWWPAGHGEQPLYDLALSLVSDGEAIDERSLRIGLREVALIREPDEAGETFAFEVNGKLIFAKGANWIPVHSFPSIGSERLQTLMHLARDCGMNMLRIWGGGVYESESFYDLCDELGLLVWQDFPYACAQYPDDEPAVAVAASEARAAVRRLRNHTSLALWCGNNENQWLRLLGAFGRPIPRLCGEVLYDKVLPDVVAEEDPGRPYWPGSPFGTGPDPSGDHDGDSHYWNVWHGAGDWRHYEKCRARFVSEFGFSGPPAQRTLEEALDPSDLGVDTPGMRWHDKTSKGYGTYLGYIALHYPEPATFDDLIYYGQLNQADAMRFGIEHFRRLRPHTMGTLVWQLNDCWPVQSWAWVDYQLRPKAAWYAARRFYAPLLLSLVLDDERVTAHLVNDGNSARTGVIELRALTPDGTVVWTHSEAAEVNAEASVAAFSVGLPAYVLDVRREVLIVADFCGVHSDLLLVEPKELQLPEPTVTASVTTNGDRFAVALSTDRVAPRLMLSVEGSHAHVEDCFFDLLPGRDVVVQLTPETPLSLDELRSRLRWRSLGLEAPRPLAIRTA